MKKKQNTPIAFNIWLIISCILLLSSCASQIEGQIKVTLQPGVDYYPQLMPKSEQHYGELSRFVVKKNNQQHQLLVQTESNAENISVVGMSVEGMTLFTLTWYSLEDRLLTKKNIPIDLEPLRILAEMQLVKWPVAVIAQGLVGASIEEKSSGDRIITNLQGEVIYKIDHSGNNIVINNLSQGYIIEIERLEKWNTDK